jgi:hypothetical protein
VSEDSGFPFTSRLEKEIMQVHLSIEAAISLISPYSIEFVNLWREFVDMGLKLHLRFLSDLL